MAADIWPADTVERRPVASLTPYARNARTHNAEQVDQIAAPIREWGWTIPVLVDEDGTLIAGHGRVLAAHKLGIAEIPVMVASGWSEGKRRVYALADNKLALNADWDSQLLKIEIGDLRDAGLDLSLIGFSGKELKKLFAGGDDLDGSPQLRGTTFKIIITCNGEQHQTELLERFGEEGLECAALMS